MGQAPRHRQSIARQRDLAFGVSRGNLQPFYQGIA